MNNAQSSPLHLWLIEDDLLFTESLCGLLREVKGVMCDGTFTSCEAALEKINQEAAPQIVFLDIGLPGGMSGIEGIKQLKERTPKTDIVMLTIFEDDEKIHQSIMAGASGYIVKSPRIEDVLHDVTEVIHGGPPMNARVARKVLTMFTDMAAPKADYKLTAKEKQVLNLMTDGLGKKAIADRLELSFHTINAHIRNVYTKLHVHTCTEAIGKTLREHLLDTPM